MKLPTAEVFVSRLEEAIARTGLSQKAFASKVRRTDSTVSKWLRGDRQPRLNDLALIAEAAGVTVDWLLGRDGAPVPPELPPAVPADEVRRLLVAVEDLAEAARHLGARLPGAMREAAQPRRRTPRRG